MRRLCVVVLFLLVGAAGAQTPAPEELDEVALHWASRAAVARGVAFLRGRALADATGWVTPPHRRARVIGHTNVMVRYSERTVPTYEYETFTVYERRPGDTSHGAHTLQPVQRRRIRGIKDPQGRTVLVRDPDGPIERTERRPLYDRGGPDQWMYGRFGQNAMALHTLLRCGVPEDDEAVRRLRQNLWEFVEMYGLPDGTWDLAWLTAAFARLPDRPAEKLTREAAAKLLDGQIVDGEARGLWGPVSIHLPLLAAAYLREQALAQRYQKAQLAAKERPDSRARERDLQQAEQALHDCQRDMRRISMLAMAFDRIDAPSVRLGDGLTPAVLVAGAVHYIFNQTSADLDRTWLALYALREAARAGRLPDETWRPTFGEGRPPLPPEKSEAVLARAVHALTRFQHPQRGGWTELNLHQPVTHFDRLGRMIPGVPADARSFQPLPAPETPLSCLQGYGALLDAAEAAGFQKVLARFRAPLRAGRTRALAALAEIVPPARGTPPPTSPYQTRFHTARLTLLPGTRQQEQRPVWTQTAFQLLDRQQPNGAWRVVGREQAMSSSLRVRLETLERIDDDNRLTATSRSVAHVRGNWSSVHRSWLRSTDEISAATCWALLALVEQIRPPALVARWGEGLTPSPLPDAVLQSLMGGGTEWSYVVGTFPLDALRTEASALFFLEGLGAFAPDAATVKALEVFLRAGGLVIAHAPATDDGLAFLNSAVAPLSAAAGGGGTVGDIAGDTGFLGDFAGRLGRPLRGVRRADGSLAAVFIPTSETGSQADHVFAAPQAVRLAARLAERTLGAGVLAADYAWNLQDLGEPGEVFEVALRYLRGMARRDLGAISASLPEEELAPIEAPLPADDGEAAAAEEAPVVEPPAAPAPEAPRPPAADETF